MVYTPSTSHQNVSPLSSTPLQHAIAGSIGSATSLLILYPLERVRVEMQAQLSKQETNYQTASNKKENTFSKSGGQIKGSLNNNDNTNTHDCDTDNDKSCTSINSSKKPNSNDRNVKKVREGFWECMTRLKSSNDLYRGVKPIISTVALSNFVFFYALQISKNLVQLRTNNIDGDKTKSSSSIMSSAGRSLLASTMAGILNVLLTNPLWVANLRVVQGGNNNKSVNSSIEKSSPTLVAVKQDNIFNVMKQIMKDEGVSKLWNGTLVSLLLVSNPALQYFVYDQVKIYLLGQRRQKIPGKVGGYDGSTSLNAIEAFVLGALAKGIATVVTYPLQLAQVLLRLQKKEEVTEGQRQDSTNMISSGDDCSRKGESEVVRQSLVPYNGTRDCIIKLIRNDGMLALYAGMSAKLLQTVLTAAFTFLTYEKILNVIMKIHYSIIIRRLPKVQHTNVAYP